MSVYQVEEYYIYIEWDAHLTPCAQASVTDFIKGEGFDELEVETKSLTVDGFDSESDAEEFERKLLQLLGEVK